MELWKVNEMKDLIVYYFYLIHRWREENNINIVILKEINYLHQVSNVMVISAKHFKDSEQVIENLNYIAEKTNTVYFIFNFEIKITLKIVNIIITDKKDHNKV